MIDYHDRGGMWFNYECITDLGVLVVVFLQI